MSLHAQSNQRIEVDDRIETADNQRGTVKYIGEVPPLGPGFWVGVDLDDPVENGNDGTINGQTYFEAMPAHGTFIPYESATPILDSMLPQTYNNYYNDPANASNSEFERTKNRLSRKIDRRPSMKDIELRGIVPPKYFNDPRAAQRRRTLTHEIAASHLEDYLPQRPNQQQVEQSGIVPQEYFEDPEASQVRKKLYREAVTHNLEDFVGHRPSRQQIADKNIIPQEYADHHDDTQEAKRAHKSHKRELSQNLDNKLGRRPTITSLGEMHIIPHDYLDVLVQEATIHHKRDPSRLEHMKGRLGKHLPEPVAEALAGSLLNNLNAKAAEQQNTDNNSNNPNNPDDPNNNIQSNSINEETEIEDITDTIQNNNSNLDNSNNDNNNYNHTSMDIENYDSDEDNNPHTIDNRQQTVLIRGDDDEDEHDNDNSHDNDNNNNERINDGYEFGLNEYVPQRSPHENFVPLNPREKAEVKANLTRRLSRRASQDQIEIWGYVPPDYFENPQKSIMAQTIGREMALDVLESFYPKRPDLSELTNKGVVHPDYIKKDVEEAKAAEKRRKLSLKQDLNDKLNPKKRMSVVQLADKGYIPESWLLDLYGLADVVRRKHKRMESAIEDLEKQLQVPSVLASAVATDILDEIEGVDPVLTSKNKNNDNDNNGKTVSNVVNNNENQDNRNELNENNNRDGNNDNNKRGSIDLEPQKPDILALRSAIEKEVRAKVQSEYERHVEETLEEMRDKSREALESLKNNLTNEYENKISSLNSRIDKMHDELNSANNDFVNMSQKYRGSEEENEKLRNENDALSRNVESVQVLEKQYLNRINELETQTNDLENTVNQLRNDKKVLSINCAAEMNKLRQYIIALEKRNTQNTSTTTAGNWTFGLFG